MMDPGRVGRTAGPPAAGRDEAELQIRDRGQVGGTESAAAGLPSSGEPGPTLVRSRKFPTLPPSEVGRLDPLRPRVAPGRTQGGQVR